MQLAGPFAFGSPPDRAAAIGVLRAAAAAGVDHIDTAQYHLRENLAAEDVALDHEALREIDGVSA
jgi:aryl-alcohol dehydrogenase-like predicted oxidoreductase